MEDKQNPIERALFQKRLSDYLAVAKDYPELLQVWFWDESGFSLQVIRRKNWGKKGQRRKIAGQRRRGRINVMGAIRESDHKRVCFFIKKGNADTFLEQLQQFNEFIKQEWVNKGNCSIDFQSKGLRIILILDNASFHKRQDIFSKISKELPNFRLDFLPAYTPDYNIIELVWHSCKEYIAHRLFQSVDELKQLLDRLLNQGELVIKWHRQIKNKGNNHYIAA